MDISPETWILNRRSSTEAARLLAEQRAVLRREVNLNPGTCSFAAFSSTFQNLSFTRSKTTFYTLRNHILLCKRARFSHLKASFWSPNTLN